ncbi:coenzyme PQQ synthesis protein D (PqqD) [Ruminiclostridium sufflavum DSM 19573]|uniref:Coenzyme PQQ synthesis protein D (PqqD) n=1 Tax=Ruminiclostridium sufflavum DSM 19573 TaxID=1121337 RepID=A0A318XSD4_9FIRM|nr:PqqD family protein [Ruminiclostridium sufflavum]PYG89484.1 coenzyme PQQ synthesis protein D (PqqD) [Ruminiclostridium sufflavum DSM 19573]
MKIKSGFMLREIAGQSVVVPLGARVVEFNGIMTLSESGALLWRELEKNSTMEEMVELLLTEYSIDRETARNDVEQFVQSMLDSSLIENV